MSNITKLEIDCGTDDWGESEEFTWDLFPVVDPTKTLHLLEDGLPKIGARITPGMVLVGKIGKSRYFDPNHEPTALDVHSLPFEELKSRYGSMWKDTSLYADTHIKGIVKEAYFEVSNGRKKAVVVLERDEDVH
jgi:DNA-directed RNA polymerase beta subunit